MGGAVITVGRGSKGFMLGLVPSTLAHAALLLLSTMLKAGSIPAWPEGLQGHSNRRRNICLSPLQIDASNKFGPWKS